ncbi:hypothetical protein WJX84_008929 [Apatococcus fuscideae]|uniref:Uncharacterized protein n=1 Tax=Apatococcus fuscideae TaxID=2026836 RepID=A0AAW1STV2_9CHLO
MRSDTSTLRSRRPSDARLNCSLGRLEERAARARMRRKPSKTDISTRLGAAEGRVLLCGPRFGRSGSGVQMKRCPETKYAGAFARVQSAPQRLPPGELRLCEYP